MNAKTQDEQTLVSSISAFQLQPGQFLFKFWFFMSALIYSNICFSCLYNENVTAK